MELGASSIRAANVVLIGPTPPPYHGVAVMTRSTVEVLNDLKLLSGHLDTRDSRPNDNIGRLDLTNLLLGVRHAIQLHLLLRRRPSATVLIPISQGPWGFLRDSVFVLVTRLHRRRLIVHLHGGGLSEFTRRSSAPMRWLIRAVFRQADEAWALTPALRTQFAGLVPAERVRCVENVVEDIGAPEHDEVPTARPRSGSLRVLYLSNLKPEKGCFDVVAAVRRLGDAAASWEVRLAGAAHPAVAARLRRDVAALPTPAARVAVLGVHTGTAKAALLRWADVFVYPTRYPAEGQPLVLLEAMAAGLPIITTPRAGIPDTVRDGAEGLLVPEGDIEALARALLTLARDAELRDALGRAARRRYEERYRPERLRQDLARLFGSSRCDGRENRLSSQRGSPLAIR